MSLVLATVIPGRAHVTREPGIQKRASQVGLDLGSHAGACVGSDDRMRGGES